MSNHTAHDQPSNRRKRRSESKPLNVGALGLHAKIPRCFPRRGAQEARTIYPRPNIDALIAGESRGGEKTVLPGPGPLPCTERARRGRESLAAVTQKRSLDRTAARQHGRHEVS